MSELIKVGDIVDVCFKDTLPAKATVLNMPRGDGDLIQVKYAKDGMVEAINPHSYEFLCLQKREQK